MKLDEAIAWLTTEGRFDMEGHCCPTSSEAVNALLDALRNGAIFTFEEVVHKAHHDKCMQIEIAKRMKQERPKGKWTNDGGPFLNRWICSECGYKNYLEPTKFCGGCGAEMEEET